MSIERVDYRLKVEIGRAKCQCERVSGDLEDTGLMSKRRPSVIDYPIADSVGLLPRFRRSLQPLGAGCWLWVRVGHVNHAGRDPLFVL